MALQLPRGEDESESSEDPSAEEGSFMERIISSCGGVCKIRRFRDVKSPGHLLQYRTRDCTVYKPGDFAYLESQSPAETPFYICSILSFKLGKKDNVFVRIKWFYRTREVPDTLYSLLSQERDHEWAASDKSGFPGGWLCEDPLDEQFRERELFCSKHIDCVPASSLRGRCFVTHFKDISEAQEFDPLPDHFFYILEYNPETRRLANFKGKVEVGPGYQAKLPELRPVSEAAEDEVRVQTMFLPDRMPDTHFTTYINSAKSIAATYARMALGDEYVRRTLTSDAISFQAVDVLHQCAYNRDQALTQLCKAPAPKCAMDGWTPEEKKAFLRGLKQVGKNFFTIRADYLPHRTTAELVEFYYFWKKTPGAASSSSSARGGQQRGAKTGGTNGVGGGKPILSSSNKKKAGVSRISKILTTEQLLQIKMSCQNPPVTSGTDAESDDSDSLVSNGGGLPQAPPSCVCKHCGTSASKNFTVSGQDKIVLCYECRSEFNKYGRLPKVTRPPPHVVVKPVPVSPAAAATRAHTPKETNNNSKPSSPYHRKPNSAAAATAAENNPDKFIPIKHLGSPMESPLLKKKRRCRSELECKQSPAAPAATPVTSEPAPAAAGPRSDTPTSSGSTESLGESCSSTSGGQTTRTTPEVSDQERLLSTPVNHPGSSGVSDFIKQEPGLSPPPTDENVPPPPPEEESGHLEETPPPVKMEVDESEAGPLECNEALQLPPFHPIADQSKKHSKRLFKLIRKWKRKQEADEEEPNSCARTDIFALPIEGHTFSNKRIKTEKAQSESPRLPNMNQSPGASLASIESAELRGAAAHAQLLSQHHHQQQQQQQQSLHQVPRVSSALTTPSPAAAAAGSFQRPHPPSIWEDSERQARELRERDLRNAELAARLKESAAAAAAAAGGGQLHHGGGMFPHVSSAHGLPNLPPPPHQAGPQHLLPPEHQAALAAAALLNPHLNPAALFSPHGGIDPALIERMQQEQRLQEFLQNQARMGAAAVAAQQHHQHSHLHLHMHQQMQMAQVAAAAAAASGNPSGYSGGDAAHLAAFLGLQNGSSGGGGGAGSSLHLPPHGFNPSGVSPGSAAAAAAHHALSGLLQAGNIPTSSHSGFGSARERELSHLSSLFGGGGAGAGPLGSAAAPGGGGHRAQNAAEEYLASLTSSHAAFSNQMAAEHELRRHMVLEQERRAAIAQASHSAAAAAAVSQSNSSAPSVASTGAAAATPHLM